MNYQFDKGFHATEEIPVAEGNYDEQKNTGPETWKYGEGHYDHLSEAPDYGYHGQLSHNGGKKWQRKPWMHYYVIDNIKYFVVMTIFYSLFTAKMESLGFSEVRYMATRDEMLAVFGVLFALLFFKSTWRLVRMR